MSIQQPVETTVKDEAIRPKTSKHARPGSKWNSTNRFAQKGFNQPKGFARGAKVK